MQHDTAHSDWHMVNLSDISKHSLLLTYNPLLLTALSPALLAINTPQLGDHYAKWGVLIYQCRSGIFVKVFTFTKDKSKPSLDSYTYGTVINREWCATQRKVYTVSTYAPSPSLIFSLQAMVSACYIMKRSMFMLPFVASLLLSSDTNLKINRVWRSF